MAENAGHLVKVGINTSQGSYTEISGINDVSLTRDRDPLETTHFKDTTASKLRIMGLKDAKISMAGNLDLADSAQSQIRSRYSDGASAFVEIQWDGSTSTDGEFKVVSYSEKASVGGLVEISAEFEASPLTGTGAVWG